VARRRQLAVTGDQLGPEHLGQGEVVGVVAREPVAQFPHPLGNGDDWLPPFRYQAPDTLEDVTARPAADSPQQPQIGIVDALRFLCEVFAIVTLGIWGFVTFPFWLNLIIGIGAPLLAIVLWGLFRAPRAVLAVDPFVKALVEIVVMGTAAYAWADMHQWIIFGVFTVVALASGLIAGRRDL
jgi:hypothetical protein